MYPRNKTFQFQKMVWISTSCLFPWWKFSMHLKHIKCSKKSLGKPPFSGRYSKNYLTTVSLCQQDVHSCYLGNLQYKGTCIQIQWWPVTKAGTLGSLSSLRTERTEGQIYLCINQGSRMSPTFQPRSLSQMMEALGRSPRPQCFWKEKTAFPHSHFPFNRSAPRSVTFSRVLFSLGSSALLFPHVKQGGWTCHF